MDIVYTVSRVRKVFASLLCATAVASPTLAQTFDLQRSFADCAGRYSALEHHLWLTDGAAAGRAAMQREAFADLLTAVLPGDPDAASSALNQRIAARAAQAALLRTAAFGQNDAARSAKTLASQYIASCDRLLLGG
ncbi:MAG: hypothetical protein AAF667_10015 [Pseudomonadota bacterium]